MTNEVLVARTICKGFTQFSSATIPIRYPVANLSSFHMRWEIVENDTTKTLFGDPIFIVDVVTVEKVNIVFKYYLGVDRWEDSTRTLQLWRLFNSMAGPGFEELRIRFHMTQDDRSNFSAVHSVQWRRLNCFAKIMLKAATITIQHSGCYIAGTVNTSTHLNCEQCLQRAA